MSTITAFVLVDAEPARIHDLAEEIVELDGVSDVYSTAGEADLVVVLRVRENEELATVVTERIAPLAGITGTRTLIAFRAYRSSDFSLGDT